MGDELRLATERALARLRHLAQGPRGDSARRPESANGAFWIDNASGQFTTSTYYMEHLPEWARAFNASGRPG
jgi:hypothetical protein